MVMGIPTVEFLISQKSTKVLHMKPSGVLIPNFADSPRGCKEKACQHTSAQVTDFQDVVCG